MDGFRTVEEIEVPAYGRGWILVMRGKSLCSRVGVEKPGTLRREAKDDSRETQCPTVSDVREAKADVDSSVAFILWFPGYPPIPGEVDLVVRGHPD